jgi:hypothetical protein
MAGEEGDTVADRSCPVLERFDQEVIRLAATLSGKHGCRPVTARAMATDPASR